MEETLYLMSSTKNKVRLDRAWEDYRNGVNIHSNNLFE
ncbi:MAG: hypothetical protein ACJA1A_000569 [Saprospiraceae bacterium]|jgi:hypothetical protein